MKKTIRKLIRLFAGILAFYRKREMNSETKRIIILACNWLGDTFWVLQTIPQIKKRYSDSEIYVCTKSFSTELFNGFLRPENIIQLDNITSDRKREKFSIFKYISDIKRIREINGDILFDFTCNRYSAIASFFSKAYSVGTDNADEFSSLYSFQAKSSLLPSRLSLRPAGIYKLFTGGEIPSQAHFFPPVPRFLREEIYGKFSLEDGEHFALIAPGSGWEQKQWGKENFRKAAEYLASKGLRIVVSGSQAETPLCREIAENISNPIVASGSLRESIALLPFADIVLCNDSGISHISAAFGTPTVIFFCCTNSEMLAPSGNNVTVLRSTCPEAPSKGVLMCKKAVSCRSEQLMDIPFSKAVNAIDSVLEHD